MNYCEWSLCGDYTGNGCKAFGTAIQCKTKIEAEPYADARIAARDKEWEARLNELHPPCCYDPDDITGICSDVDTPENCPCHYEEIQQLKQSMGVKE